MCYHAIIIYVLTKVNVSFTNPHLLIVVAFTGTGWATLGGILHQALQAGGVPVSMRTT